MIEKTIGMLHPGAMGVTVGQSFADSGHRVLWAGDGRSDQSRQRAAEAGFEDAGSLDHLASQSNIIVSVCPPHAAIDLAETVAKAGFKGIYLDANAISTASAGIVQGLIETAGCDFVDGGIIGPPAKASGTTRLYLSGAHAQSVADLLTGGLLPGIAISETVGDASALKMAYAAYTKGHSALLLLSRALAKANGIEQHLLDEWALSQPGLQALCDKEGVTSAKKAWRFNGEMREIAATMQHASLPPQFHEGAAELYDRLAGFRDRDDLNIGAILNQLAAADDTP